MDERKVKKKWWGIPQGRKEAYADRETGRHPNPNDHSHT
jgi:hypothetical protein